MIPAIYFIIIVSYVVLMLGIYARDEIIVLFSVLLLFGLSIYTFINGIDTFPNTNLLVITFSAITFGIAGYFGFLASYELYKKI